MQTPYNSIKNREKITFPQLMPFRNPLNMSQQQVIKTFLEKKVNNGFVYFV